MTFQPRPSQAAKLWVAIVCLVLIALSWETRDKRHQCINFLINTDLDGVGAQVLIDKRQVGLIENSSAQGPGGGVYWGYLRPGNHVIEVVKQGFKPFAKLIVMHEEEYLGVDLQPANN